MSNAGPTSPHRRQALGLLAVLVGAALGVLVGASYGRTMWLAVDGPQERLDRLRVTFEQKQTFAEAARQADNPAEAARLSAQLPVIRREIEATEQVRLEARTLDLGRARLVAQLVDFCGRLFLRMLFLVVVPLVVTSMICGVTSLGDLRQMGRVGAWTLFYYLATGAAAVLLGIVLVETIRPGIGADDTFAYVEPRFVEDGPRGIAETLLEVVVGREGEPGSGLVPGNLFAAAAGTNVLALILFSLLFGGALASLGQRGHPAVEFFRAANEAVMRIVRLVILFTPLGVFGLIASRFVESGGAAGFYDDVVRLGWFVATVSLGLGVHFAVLCAVLALFSRRNPLRFVYQMARALLTALSTDSSSATLPVTIECAIEADISEQSAGFVLPLGATVNMDGTALYEAVAAIFIAQSVGVPLGGAELVVIFLTATLAAIGAPGIPNAGLVTLLIVLAAVGLPAAGIGTILAIDWLLDRERTVVNVFGDAVGAAVIDRWLERKKEGAGVGGQQR